jgi:hypothetical protein
MLKGFENHTSHGNTIETELPAVRQIIQEARKDNPIKSPEIERRLRLCGPQVRACVHELRLRGEPVCSSSKGYFWGTPDEVMETVTHLEQRIRSLSEIARALKGSYSTPQQVEMSLGV